MDSPSDRELERQGRRMSGSGARWLATGAILAIPGAILTIVGLGLKGHGWVFGLGLALLAIAACPGVVGFGLLSGGLVSRWSAREKPFA